MRRKGQVFLLLTLLVLTFMISISSILFDIKKAEYMEPSPDIDESLEAWKNSVETIEQIFSIFISLNSKAGTPDDNYNTEVSTELVKLEDYLNSRGFAATILLVGNAVYTAPVNGSTSFTSLSGIVSIFINSISGTEISQVLKLNVTYSAVVTSTTLVLTKSVNTNINYLSGCTINPASWTDMGNGAYTVPAPLAPGTPFTIRTPNAVELQVTTP